MSLKSIRSSKGIRVMMSVAAAKVRSEALTSRTPSMPETLQPGEVYRLRRDVYGGYNHRPDYDEGRFIHVKIVSGLGDFGLYQCTTRGESGQHLGPGGGWTIDYEKKYGIRFGRDQLEPLV